MQHIHFFPDTTGWKKFKKKSIFFFPRSVLFVIYFFGSNFNSRPHKMTTIDCSGLTAAAVLAALYNHAKPLGMGILEYDPKPMSIDFANQMLLKRKTFDYLMGRPLKTSFADYPILDVGLYDRDQGGAGTAKSIINKLKTPSGS
jgi:hypothetical protein